MGAVLRLRPETTYHSRRREVEREREREREYDTSQRGDTVPGSSQSVTSSAAHTLPWAAQLPERCCRKAAGEREREREREREEDICSSLLGLVRRSVQHRDSC